MTLSPELELIRDDLKQAVHRRASRLIAYRRRGVAIACTFATFVAASGLAAAAGLDAAGSAWSTALDAMSVFDEEQGARNDGADDTLSKVEVGSDAETDVRNPGRLKGDSRRTLLEASNDRATVLIAAASTTKDQLCVVSRVTRASANNSVSNSTCIANFENNWPITTLVDAAVGDVAILSGAMADNVSGIRVRDSEGWHAATLGRNAYAWFADDAITAPVEIEVTTTNNEVLRRALTVSEYRSETKRLNACLDRNNGSKQACGLGS